MNSSQAFQITHREACDYYIEPDDIEVSDTVTVIWGNRIKNETAGPFGSACFKEKKERKKKRNEKTHLYNQSGAVRSCLLSI